MARFDFAHYRDDDELDPVAGRHLRDRMAVAQHRHAVDLDVVLAQVIVQEADRLQAQLGILTQLAHDHRASVARAHDEDRLRSCAVRPAAGALE